MKLALHKALIYGNDNDDDDNDDDDNDVHSMDRSLFKFW